LSGKLAVDPLGSQNNTALRHKDLPTRSADGFLNQIGIAILHNKKIPRLI